MSEIIFILVTVFVAYVVYTSVNDAAAPVVTDAAQTAAEVTVKVQEKPAVNRIIQAVVAKSNDEIKNPETGEISKIPNNYRFGKRWIKDALVAEGLLDKVYKNNELDDATNVKVQAALATLKTLEKYHV